MSSTDSSPDRHLSRSHRNIPESPRPASTRRVDRRHNSSPSGAASAGDERNENGQRVLYTSICVKNISPRIAHHELRSRIEEKFSRYGPNTIKIYYKNDERMVFVNYTTYHDARKARHAKSGLVWDKWKLILEPVYYRRNCSAEQPIFVDYASVPTTVPYSAATNTRPRASISPRRSLPRSRSPNIIRRNGNDDDSAYKRENDKLRLKVQDLKQQIASLNEQLRTKSYSLEKRDGTIAKLKKTIEQRDARIDQLEQRDNVSLAASHDDNDNLHSPVSITGEKRVRHIMTDEADEEEEEDERLPSVLPRKKKIQKLSSSPFYDNDDDNKRQQVEDNSAAAINNSGVSAE